jgi:hypothetical protein
MPLYDDTRRPDVAPEDQVVIVRRFLLKCREWALEKELGPRLQRVAAELDPKEAASLHAWVAYLRFTEHAILEIENGTLDPWFTQD